MKLFYVRPDDERGFEEWNTFVWALTPLKACELVAKDLEAEDIEGFEPVERPHTDDLSDVWTVWEIPLKKPRSSATIPWESCPTTHWNAH
jgi:hypothetical protein